MKNMKSYMLYLSVLFLLSLVLEVYSITAMTGTFLLACLLPERRKQRINETIKSS